MLPVLLLTGDILDHTGSFPPVVLHRQDSSCSYFHIAAYRVYIAKIAGVGSRNFIEQAWNREVIRKGGRATRKWVGLIIKEM